MADPTRKTNPTDADVETFLATVANPRRQADAREALELMRETTGADPVMWGSSIIGFGRQPYTTADGKQHEWFAVGLSPALHATRLASLTS